MRRIMKVFRKPYIMRNCSANAVKLTRSWFLSGMMLTTLSLQAAYGMSALAFLNNLLFAVLLIIANYGPCSTKGRYVLSMTAFAIFVADSLYFPISFSGLCTASFLVTLIFAHLLTDLITPNIIGVMTAILFIIYRGRVPKTEILGGMLETVVAALTFTLMFYSLRYLQKERDRYKKKAIKDSLTGLYTFPYIVEAGERMITSGANVTALIININQFKQINDTYGYSAGNRILVKVGKIIKQEMRGLDNVVGRLWGDEFIVLIRDYAYSDPISYSAKLIDRLKKEDFTPDMELGAIKLTFSIGEAHSNKQSPMDINELLTAADMNLYYNRHTTNNDIEENDKVDLSILPEVCRQILLVLSEKDMYTYVHSQYVSQYATALARDMRLSVELLQDITIAGWLHDIGKLLIPNDILRKTARLTDEEYEVIKGHVNYGINILGNIPLSNVVKNAIKYHHERWDGKGYPYGLSGEEIPLEGRILQIIDAFAAMTVKRVYRKQLSLEEAIAEVRDKSGSQFDPEVSEVFIKVLQEKSEGKK